MGKPTAQVATYKNAVKMSAVVTLTCVLTSALFYALWTREGSTGIAMIRRGGVIYRDTNPGAFAASHYNSLLISAVAGIASLAFLFNTLYQIRRLQQLNHR